MENIYQRYADLLVNYCLELKKGQTVWVNSTYLAEPLLIEFYRETLKAGAHPVLSTGIRETGRSFYELADDHQLEWVPPMMDHAFKNFDAYLVIRAPFNLMELQNADKEKMKKAAQARQEARKIYSQRTAEGSMVRSLCQFPTEASAQAAGMSLEEYSHFVFDACNLFEEDPRQAWLDVRKFQQGIVDHLNKCKHIRYKGPDWEIEFSCEGRIWMNSDGRSNMPSGEVYTSPVENSVNGRIKYTYPAIYMGREVEDVELIVKDGEVVEWNATRGKEILDDVFTYPGARVFGEAAIGTNKKIQKMTRDILFDEKIAGTVHMAVGQSYLQTGGKNQSSIHWDMITDMTDGGEIYADDELIYKDGEFLIS